MAQIPPTETPPVSEEAFIADRQKFWGEFTSFTTSSVIGVAILLVLLAIFLV